MNHRRSRVIAVIGATARPRLSPRRNWIRQVSPSTTSYRRTESKNRVSRRPPVWRRARIRSRVLFLTATRSRAVGQGSQLSARSEVRHALGRNIHLSLGQGISTSPRSPGARGKGPKPADFYPVALAQRTNHAIEDYLDQTVGLLVRIRYCPSNLKLEISFCQFRQRRRR